MKSTNSYIETDLGNIAPNPRGQYNKEVIYEYLDLVSYQGGSYLCRADEDQTVGIDPVPGQTTEVWQMVALPGNVTEEYVEKHTDVIEKAKEVETNRAAVELCQQEIEAAQLDVEQMRQDTQQAAQNASDANTEAQQAAQQAEASRSAAQTSEQNAAASRDLANTYKEAAETAKSAAETAAQNASESKTAAETAAQNAAQSKADIDSIKAAIEEAAKGENVSQIQQNMNDIGQLKESLGNKITKFYASNQGETHITDSDNGKIQDMMIYGKSSQDVAPTLENPVEIKGVVNPTVKVTNEDNVQSFTVNDVILYAVPVKEGGNITVNSQQYIADYIDIKNGKIVKYVKKLFLKPFQWLKAINKGVLRFYGSTMKAVGIDGNKVIKNTFSISSHFAFVTGTPDRIGTFTVNTDGTNANVGFAFSTDTTTSSDDFNNWILNNKPFVLLPVLKEELPLTSEQILALKELSTYYPTTNISINSEQLDGYTVFNYPISMQNGWNYVKQQLNDNRDYIYGMDTQSAEAYVNSEYAVALTELEV